MMTFSSRNLSGLLIGVSTLIPLVSVGVATASTLPGGIGDQWQAWVLDNLNPLTQVMGELEQSAPLLEAVMQSALGQIWQDVQTYTQSTVPNPDDLRRSSEGLGAGVLTASPVVRQRDLANLYDQETARVLAMPMLGHMGETWLTDRANKAAVLLEGSQQSSEQIQRLAEQAQSLGVTQEVMKTQAQIDRELAALITYQTQLDAQSHTALLELQRLEGVAAQIAANTSEGIDETNRRDRLERQIHISGSTQAPIYIPGLLGTGNTEHRSPRRD